MLCPGKVFLVGGPVRDQLLGVQAHDNDWVVTGTTPEQMLAAGFTQVGKDFPVFLHPQTREEYALARTERKQGHGYQGFICHTDPDVTLEDDLQRRDFTINAMALSPDNQLTDPYQGQADLQNRLLRHVSPAFSEDPLRVLRGARFLARFYHLGFRVAEETLTLMSELAIQGELQHLSAERVWKETERALEEADPEQYFQLLQQTHALEVWWPELQTLCLQPDALTIPDELKGSGQSMQVWAWLLKTLSSEQIQTLNIRLKSPRRYLDFALLYQAFRHTLLMPDSAEQVLMLLEKSGALKQGGLFTTLLSMLPADDMLLKQQWQSLADNVRQISARQFSEQGLKGPELGQAIRQQRIQEVSHWLNRL